MTYTREQINKLTSFLADAVKEGKIDLDDAKDMIARQDFVAIEEYRGKSEIAENA